MIKSVLKKAVMTVLSAAIVLSAVPAVFADDAEPADYKVIYFGKYEGKTSTNYVLDKGSDCDDESLVFDTTSGYIAIKPQINKNDITFTSGEKYVISLKMRTDAAADKDIRFAVFAKDIKKPEDLDWGTNPKNVRLSNDWQTYSWTITGDGEYYGVAPYIRFQGKNPTIASGQKIYLKDIKITQLKNTTLPELKATPAMINTSKEIKITYNYDMSNDAEDLESYKINGVTPISAAYDSATKTVSLAPGEAITGTSAEVTMNVTDVIGRTLNTVADTDNGRKVINYGTVTANIYPETDDYKVIYFGQYTGKTSENYDIYKSNLCGNDYLAITDDGSKYVAIKPQINGTNILFENGKKYVISAKMRKDEKAGVDTRFYAMCNTKDSNGDFSIATNIRLSNDWQTCSWTITGNSDYTTAPYIRFQGNDGDKFYLKDIKITQLKNTKPTALKATPVEMSTNKEIKITYNYDMSDDAGVAESYKINGVAPKSAAYDSATKTVTLVPGEAITGTSAEVTMNVTDVIGRTLNTVTTVPNNTNRKVINFGTVTAKYPDNTFGAVNPTVSNGTATVENLYNTTADAKKALLIIAAFDNEKCLVRAAVNNITVYSGSTVQEQTVSLSGIPENCTVKAFIWEDSTFKPIGK